MRDTIRKYRSTISASLVAAAAFFYLLEPILAFTGRTVLVAAGFLSDTSMNRIYAESAHLEVQDFSFFLTSYFMVGVTGVIFLISLLILRSTFSEGRGSTGHTGPGNPDRVAVDRTGKKTQRSVVAVLSVVNSILLISWTSAVIVANHFELSLTSSFRQHLRILAPVLSEQDEEELLSEWSQMTTTQDFDRLYAQLSAHAKRHGLTLPANTIYSRQGF